FADTLQLPRYCQVVRSNPMGLARCLSSHQEMTRRVTQCNRPICQRCHAGLTTVHFPVRVAGKGFGDIQTVCALRRGERSNTAADLHVKISGLRVSRKDIREAAEDLQIISKQKAHRVIDWLELVANYLAEASNHPRSRDVAETANGGSFPPGCPSEEHRIRLEIGRAVPLPSWRAQRSTGGSAALVEQVAEFLNQYYYLPLSSQVIAQALGFDPSYFAKVFKQYARESLTDYLKRVRLNRAQRLLRDPYLSILEVAERTGFADPSYFTRVFRSAVGMTPTQFRELSGHSS
ncbi:MAG: helix-turn-helix domain-containing protein, partial [bacterium]